MRIAILKFMKIQKHDTHLYSGILLGALAGLFMGLVLYTLVSVGWIVLQGLEPLRIYQPFTIFSLICTMSGLFGGAAGALVGMWTPKKQRRVQWKA